MNEVLQRFHRYALSRTVLPLSLLIGAVIATAWSLAPDSPWLKFLSPLISAASVGAAFMYLEKKVRLDLWRVAYPELDFAGEWQGGTQYDRQQVSIPDSEAQNEPFSKQHAIRFTQNCLEVAVDYDRTEDFHGWSSTVATLVSGQGKVSLRYAYEVTYRKDKDADPRLPISSKGLEEVFVVQPQKGQRPTHITGTFAHTVDGPRPLYSGTVEFQRTVSEPPETLRSRILQFIVTKLMKPPAE